MTTDEHYMNLALKEAQKALEGDEVPVGAIVVVQTGSSVKDGTR